MLKNGKEKGVVCHALHNGCGDSFAGTRHTLRKRQIPGMVSRDEQYQNAMRNSDKQEARTESDRVLQKVIFSIMADNMELFKQYTDNPEFKKWLSDLVFNLTYNKDGKPYQSQR